jgi:hypothetical protein
VFPVLLPAGTPRANRRTSSNLFIALCQWVEKAKCVAGRCRGSPIVDRYFLIAGLAVPIYETMNRSVDCDSAA